MRKEVLENLTLTENLEGKRCGEEIIQSQFTNLSLQIRTGSKKDSSNTFYMIIRTTKDKELWD